MNFFLKFCFCFLLFLSINIFSQTVRVIDNKGTINQIDNSKWQTSTGSSIYNKNNTDVGIGTSTPDASAKLDVSSTTKGFLPPRMTTLQRDLIAAPANGLVIFNTTANAIEINTGTVSIPVWRSLLVPDATTSINGIIRLAGDLSGTASSPQIVANAITTAEISDGTIRNADIENGVGGIFKGSGSLVTNTVITGGGNSLALTSSSSNGFSVDGTTFSVDAANNSIGMGTTAPSSSAALDITSTTKGFLPPRIALLNSTDVTTINSPAIGLLVYNTATSGTIPNNLSPGYYFWDGLRWNRLYDKNSVPNYALSTSGKIQINAYSPASSIVSQSIITSGRPVLIIASGDGDPDNSSPLPYCQMRLFRNGIAIGKIVQIEPPPYTSGVNQAFSLNFIDNPPAGNNIYEVRVVGGQGIFTFSENDGFQLTLLEL